MSKAAPESLAAFPYPGPMVRPGREDVCILYDNGHIMKSAMD